MANLKKTELSLCHGLSTFDHFTQIFVQKKAIIWNFWITWTLSFNFVILHPPNTPAYSSPANSVYFCRLQPLMFKINSTYLVNINNVPIRTVNSFHIGASNNVCHNCKQRLDCNNKHVYVITIQLITGLLLQTRHWNGSLSNYVKNVKPTNNWCQNELITKKQDCWTTVQKCQMLKFVLLK